MPKKGKAPKKGANELTREPITLPVDEASGSVFEVSVSDLPIDIPPEWQPEFESPDKLKPSNDTSPFLTIDSDNDSFSLLFTNVSWSRLGDLFPKSTIVSVDAHSDFTSQQQPSLQGLISHVELPLCQQIASVFQLVSDINAHQSLSSMAVPAPWSLIYPQSTDKKSGVTLPSVSKSGLYCVKLYFAGAWRGVLVNDNVPVSSENDNKCLLPSISDSNDLWPQLVCKAVMKLFLQTRRWPGTVSLPGVFETLTGASVLVPNRMLGTVSQWIGMGLDELQKQCLISFAVPLYEYKSLVGKMDAGKIENWAGSPVTNFFEVLDVINKHTMKIVNKSQDGWAVLHCSDGTWKAQHLVDVWSDQTCAYEPDRCVMVFPAGTGRDEKNTLVALVVNTFAKGDDQEQMIRLSTFDMENNECSTVLETETKQQTASIVVSVECGKIYFLDVLSSSGFQISKYSCMDDNGEGSVLLAGRTGNETIWNAVGCEYIEFETTYKEMNTNQTNVIFNLLLSFPESCEQVQLFDVLLHCVMADPALLQRVTLMTINLDDYSSQSIVFFELSKIKMKPNKRGYCLIAFCKPDTYIVAGNCELKLIYKQNSFDAKITQQSIQMENTVDYKIEYQDNFKSIIFKDALNLNDSNYVFCEFKFESKEKVFASKIIELIDKETNNVLKKFETINEFLIIPCLDVAALKSACHENASICLQVQVDKNQLDGKLLCSDERFTCSIRFISDGASPIGLIPDTSKQEEFDRIIEEWQSQSKTRAAEGEEARQKALEKLKDKDLLPTLNVVKAKENVNPHEKVSDEFFVEERTVLQERISESNKTAQEFQEWRENAPTNIVTFRDKVTDFYMKRFEEMKDFSTNDQEQQKKFMDERKQWDEVVLGVKNAVSSLSDKKDTFGQCLASQLEDVNKGIESISGIIDSQVKEIVKEAKATVKALIKAKGQPLPQSKDSKSKKSAPPAKGGSKKQDGKGKGSAPDDNWSDMHSEILTKINALKESVPSWKHKNLATESISEIYLHYSYSIESIVKAQQNALKRVSEKVAESLEKGHADIAAETQEDIESLKTKFPETTVNSENPQDSIINQINLELPVPDAVDQIEKSIHSELNALCVTLLRQCKMLLSEKSSENAFLVERMNKAIETSEMCLCNEFFLPLSKKIDTEAIEKESDDSRYNWKGVNIQDVEKLLVDLTTALVSDESGQQILKIREYKVVLPQKWKQLLDKVWEHLEINKNSQPKEADLSGAEA